MSPYNLDALHKSLYNNAIKIRNIEKENKSIIDTIKVVDTINKYDDDKLDNLDSQLKEILNLQKKINNEITTEVCKCNKDKITEKYLDLPFDINQIIRKKIIDDSVTKRETDSIDYVLKNIDRFFLTVLIQRVGDITHNCYEDRHTNLQIFSADIHRGIENIDDTINMLQYPNITWLLSRVINTENRKNKWIIEDLIINKYKNYVESKLEQIKNKHKHLVLRLKNLFSDSRTKQYGEIEFHQFYQIEKVGDCLIRKTNGKKNGMGFRKLKKTICSIFVDEIPLFMNENTYNEWDDTGIFDTYGFNYNDWFYQYENNINSMQYNSFKHFDNPRYIKNASKHYQRLIMN
jgi:hypothetical protein